MYIYVYIYIYGNIDSIDGIYIYVCGYSNDHSFIYIQMASWLMGYHRQLIYTQVYMLYMV